MASDVFVSYAHRDNQAAEGLPFVSRLVKFIQIEVGKKYGRDIEVFWDEALASGTQWNKDICEQLTACRVFLPIVSPSWTNSKWAGREWDAVWARVEEDEALGTQTRIVPVSFELSKGFTSSLPEQQRSLQFKRHFRNVMSEWEFRMEADSLAGDISGLLKKLDGLSKPQVDEATSDLLKD